jgi:pyruvate dehydrogenase E2 component (dihydrolipoamide acetyltransferase)
MPTNILMPALSPTMTEGTLAKWIKHEGDAVKAGDIIAEIETDKATMEVEAVDEGKIGKILVQEGTAGVAVNTPIAMLLEEGEDASALKEASKAQAKPEQKSKDQDKQEAKATDQKATLHSDEGKVGAKSFSQGEKDGPAKREGEGMDKSSGNRIFASPLARRMAEQMGVDLSTLKGSGPHGRIVKSDLDASGNIPSPSRQAAGPSLSQKGEGIKAPVGPNAKQLADAYGMKYKEIPNNSIRKVVARRLVESKQTVPHFYLTIECNIDRLMKTRAEMNEQADGKYKLSVNDFVIKACAAALKAYPAANTAWTDEAILQFENADISVAVSTPNGLMTPIVKAAEGKGLKQISDEVKDLAKRARDGKLKPDEFQGGTFCVSNLGMYGIQEFGAIINPPQSCILAVGAGEQKPYVEKGEIKIGTFMKCTLSVDHRSVDGSVGAEYLQILKRYIENPIAMIL